MQNVLEKCPYCSQSVRKERLDVHKETKCPKRSGTKINQAKNNIRKVSRTLSKSVSKIPTPFSSKTKTYKHYVPITSNFNSRQVAFTGGGPYDPQAIIGLLPFNIRKKFIVCEDMRRGQKFGRLDSIVIGREGFSKKLIESFAAAKDPRIRFIPQEGFLAELLMHEDWWHNETRLLNDFLQHHEGLRYARSCFSMSGDFRWPSTNVNVSNINREADISFRETTPLYDLGYSVEKKLGLSREARWRILQEAEKKLGLKEVAYTIADNCKKFKRQRTDKYDAAIEKWEYDLGRLKREYYDKRANSRFSWPSTKQ